MKSYFRTQDHREKMKEEDFALLYARLKRDKILFVIFLILSFISWYVLLVFTFVGNNDKNVSILSLPVSIIIFFVSVVFPIITFVLIYAIHNIKKGIKKGSLRVVRGVITGKEYAGSSRANYFWIGGSTLLKVGFWHDWKFKEGMCIEYKSMNKNYFVSLRRYDNEMYDVEKTAKREHMPEIDSFRKNLGNNI